MRPEDIIRDSGVLEVKGNPDIEITTVCNDSRKVAPGAMFIAVKGHDTDGHAYIGKALEAGAAAIVYEEDSSVASLLQNDTRDASLVISSQYTSSPEPRLSFEASVRF